MWKYISGVPKVVEEKKKEKNPNLLVIQRAQRSTRRTDRGSFQRNGKMTKMVGVTRGGGGGGKLLGE